MRLVRTVVAAALLTAAAQLFTSGAPLLGSERQSGVASVATPRGAAIQSNALACEALLTTSILPASEGKRLEARTSLGTDKLALEIHGRVLKFMTRAAVEAGMATAAEFQILRNDDDALAAVNYQSGALGSTLSSLLLNKKNGLAVWTKSHPSFLVDEQPDTQAFYLRCR